MVAITISINPVSGSSFVSGYGIQVTGHPFDGSDLEYYTGLVPKTLIDRANKSYIMCDDFNNPILKINEADFANITDIGGAPVTISSIDDLATAIKGLL